MGNGYDTLMLCEAVGPTGCVYGFDIQQEAVEMTKRRLREHGMSDRAVLLHAGHEEMKKHIQGRVKAIAFNLGWLPGGDHTITTRCETTCRAVRDALELLMPGGVLTLCAYPGHEEGEHELQALTELFSSLPNKIYNVLRQEFLNANSGAPVCFVIQRTLASHRSEI